MRWNKFKILVNEFFFFNFLSLFSIFQFPRYKIGVRIIAQKDFLCRLSQCALTMFRLCIFNVKKTDFCKETLVTTWEKSIEETINWIKFNRLWENLRERTYGRHFMPNFFFYCMKETYFNHFSSSLHITSPHLYIKEILSIVMDCKRIFSDGNLGFLSTNGNIESIICCVSFNEVSVQIW